MAAGATPTSEYGGYEYEFVNTPPDRMLCKICKYPSRDPYMTLCCGHPFCKSCLDVQRQARSIEYACPMCRKKEPDFKTVHYIPLDREIKELQVYCTNKGNGCQWQNELSNLTPHLNGCQFEEVKCSNECGKMIQRQYVTKHVEIECPRRPVNCQYCHETGEYQYIEGQHKERCPKLPLPCPNRCGTQNILSEHMETHMKECPLEIVQCEYHNVGCRAKMVRKDQERHKKEDMENHLMMMQTKLIEVQQLFQGTFESQLLKIKSDVSAELLATKNQFMLMAATKDELNTTNQQLTALNSWMDQTVNNLEVTKEELSVEISATKELSATKKELATVNNIVHGVSNDLSHTKKHLSATDNSVSITKTQLLTTVNELSVKLSEVTGELFTVKQDLHVTKNELLAAKRELAATTELHHDVDNLKKAVRGFDVKFEDTEKSLNALQGQFIIETKMLRENQQQEKLDQWTLKLHTLSISGDKTCPVMVRVSEVVHKKQSKTKWHSHPFYTHEKGYKMCLRVIINGTGHGENSHVSVFLYLMKGNYDATLKWPLIGGFEIVLLNQKMDREHFINNPIKFTEKTPSAIASKVVAKPPDEIARDGLGRNEFISHEELGKETPTCQYLKDDCIFIRVQKLPP